VTLFIQLCMIAATSSPVTLVGREAPMAAESSQAGIADRILPDRAGSGSDAAALTTTATRDGDSYVVTARRPRSRSGPGRRGIVFARMTAGAPRASGALLVPFRRPRGLAPHLQLRSASGCRSADRSRSTAYACGRQSARRRERRVHPGDDRVRLQPGDHRALLRRRRAAALDETVEYAKQRHTFGKPIAKHEECRSRLPSNLT